MSPATIATTMHGSRSTKPRTRSVTAEPFLPATAEPFLPATAELFSSATAEPFPARAQHDDITRRKQ